MSTSGSGLTRSPAVPVAKHRRATRGSFRIDPTPPSSPEGIGRPSSPSAPVTVAELERDPACAGLGSMLVIGRGASASVYRAEQASMDRVVALKVIDVSLETDRSRQAFRDECAATGRLNEHPNIVTVHESGVLATGHPFLLMAHYSGGSLADRVARSRLRLADVLRIGVKVAGALSAAHDLGIVHRDVKPANVFLSRYDDPVLGDFGISSIDTVDGGPAFTPSYAAPEVLCGQPATPASDVFALGATLFALLAGTPPFALVPGETYDQLASRISSSAPSPIDHPEVDHAINAAIASALRPSAEHRPQTARDFAEMLQWQQQRLGYDPTDVPGRTRAARRILPPGPVSAGSSLVAPPAEMGVRAEAAIIDLAAATLIAVGAVVLAAALPGAPRPSILGCVLGLVGAVAAFQLLFGALVGQTPGRRWADLCLARDPGPGQVSLWRVGARVLIGIGGAAAFGIGYLAGLGRRGRTWSDEVTMTTVVTTSTPAPAPWFWATVAVTTATEAAITLVAVLLLS